MARTAAEKLLQTIIEHPQVFPRERVWAFIKIAGEHPTEIENLERLLPDEVRIGVDEQVEAAPRDSKDWDELLFFAPGGDSDATKAVWRRGIEAIRASRRSAG